MLSRHCLQRKILEYFSGNDFDVPTKMGKGSPFLQADIKVRIYKFTCNTRRRPMLVSSNLMYWLLLAGQVFLKSSSSQAKFTPRAVARIMHGIQVQHMLLHFGLKLTLGKIYTYRLPCSNGSSKGRTDQFCEEGCSLAVLESSILSCSAVQKRLLKLGKDHNIFQPMNNNDNV